MVTALFTNNGFFFAGEYGMSLICTLMKLHVVVLVPCTQPTGSKLKSGKDIEARTNTLRSIFLVRGSYSWTAITIAYAVVGNTQMEALPHAHRKHHS